MIFVDVRCSRDGYNKVVPLIRSQAMEDMLINAFAQAFEVELKRSDFRIEPRLFDTNTENMPDIEVMIRPPSVGGPKSLSGHGARFMKAAIQSMIDWLHLNNAELAAKLNIVVCLVTDGTHIGVNVNLLTRMASNAWGCKIWAGTPF